MLYPDFQWNSVDSGQGWIGPGKLGIDDSQGVRLSLLEVSEVLNGNEITKTGKVAGFFQPMLVVTVPIFFQQQVIGAVLYIHLWQV